MLAAQRRDVIAQALNLAVQVVQDLALDAPLL